MHPLQSPWLAQLTRERRYFRLERKDEADVVVVGAGIAGVSTAYYLLRETNHSVLLLDAGRIAHGATGHNAGQVVSYFERPLRDLMEEYGPEMAIHGVNDVESAWYLLEDILREAKIPSLLHRCTGYAGLSSIPQVLEHLDASAERVKAGLSPEPILLRVSPELRREIPREYQPYYVELHHSSILRFLETEDTSYIAAVTSPKGCMNSALFCEEIVGYLLATYPDRFRVSEHVPVRSIELRSDDAALVTDEGDIRAGRVVLCTNGFESIQIANSTGEPIDRSFHEMVRGKIGYMAGYIEPRIRPAAAVSYYRNYSSYEDTYIYVTRRPMSQDEADQRSLVCIGGPERILPDRAEYEPHSPFPADIEEELEQSLQSTYKSKLDASERAFLWHGLMGYTPSGVRCIGADPRNSVLLYNLGCNGVGILPSIYGGKRVSQVLGGVHLPPSIFDPALQMQRYTAS